MSGTRYIKLSTKADEYSSDSEEEESEYLDDEETLFEQKPTRASKRSRSRNGAGLSKKRFASARTSRPRELEVDPIEDTIQFRSRRRRTRKLICCGDVHLMERPAPFLKHDVDSTSGKLNEKDEHVKTTTARVAAKISAKSTGASTKFATTSLAAYQADIWETPLEDSGALQGLRLYGTKKWKSDIVLFGAKQGVDLDDLSTDEEIRHKCDQLDLNYPCIGTVQAVSAQNGTKLWALNTHGEVTSINCGNFDIDRDGHMDCIGAGKQRTLLAFSPITGNILWDSSSSSWYRDGWEIFHPLVLPDLTGDHVNEFVITHGGVQAMTARHAGRMMLVNGSTGQPMGLRYMHMPDAGDTYCAPVLHELRDGAQFIMFGSGSEDTPGSLWAISLADFYRYVMHYGYNSKLPKRIVEPDRLWADKTKYKRTQALRIYRSEKSGILVPPVLIDMTHDGVNDLLVTSFNGHVTLLNGQTLEEIGSYSPGSGFETYSIPAPAYFNRDDTPDFMLQINRQAGSVFNYSETQILNGRTWEPIWRLRSDMYSADSSITVRSTRPHRDLYLFRVQSLTAAEQTATNTRHVKAIMKRSVRSQRKRSRHREDEETEHGENNENEGEEKKEEEEEGNHSDERLQERNDEVEERDELADEKHEDENKEDDSALSSETVYRVKSLLRKYLDRFGGADSDEDGNAKGTREDGSRLEHSEERNTERAGSGTRKEGRSEEKEGKSGEKEGKSGEKEGKSGEKEGKSGEKEETKSAEESETSSGTASSTTDSLSPRSSTRISTMRSTTENPSTSALHRTRTLAFSDTSGVYTLDSLSCDSDPTKFNVYIFLMDRSLAAEPIKVAILEPELFYYDPVHESELAAKKELRLKRKDLSIDATNRTKCTLLLPSGSAMVVGDGGYTVASGHLDLYLLSSSAALITDSEGKYLRTKLRSRLRKIYLRQLLTSSASRRMRVNSKFSNSESAGLVDVLHHEKSVRSLILRPMENQPWAAFMGSLGDNRYSESPTV